MYSGKVKVLGVFSPHCCSRIFIIDFMFVHCRSPDCLNVTIFENAMLEN